MSLHTVILPHQTKHLFLTDGGLETTLVYKKGIELPHFAACDLLFSDDGMQTLRDYYALYAKIAQRNNVGLVLETVTWRANSNWAGPLGYDEATLEQANRLAVALCMDIQREYQTSSSPMPISGCIGPRGDGYVPGDIMSAQQAEDFHDRQIHTLKREGVDFISAFTLSYINEAIGIVNAARRHQLPAVISFTLETDGKLPAGEELAEAIYQVDRQSNGGPVYYMINCAHPTHFDHILGNTEPWKARVRGLRANASCKSHTELNESTELDEGSPTELGEQYRGILSLLPKVNVLGGCCGTNEEHIQHIYQACESVYR